jgi:hypothetical protein
MNQLNLVDGLWRFANNKAWMVDAGMIGGTVKVDIGRLASGLDDFLDQIAEAATGSIVGLQSISWRLIGPDTVAFAGVVDLDGLAEDEMPRHVGCDEGLVPFLQIQYGLSASEAKHAVRRGPTKQDESDLVAQQSNGRQLRICGKTGVVRAVLDEWVIGEWTPEHIGGSTIGAMTNMLKALSAQGVD